MTAAAWPSGRGSHAALAARFGLDRADLLHWVLTTGDPLADPVAARIAEGDTDLAAALDLGVRAGRAKVDGVDRDLSALLEDLESTIDPVEDDLLDSGAEAFWTMPPAVHVISLSVGSLVRVYESPSIAAVLAGTGRLIEGADARLRETAAWLGQVMLPGALRRGGDGYVATVGVRMLHARVRHFALRGDYDAARYGVPINQVDLGRVWIDFTLTSWSAEADFGYPLSDDELDRIYRLWEVIGRLLGIDGRLIAGIRTHEAAQRIDDLFQSVTGPLTAESGILAHATINSVAGQLRKAVGLPTPMGLRLLRQLTHCFHGEARAEELAVPPALAPVIGAARALIRSKRRRLRRDPRAWRAMTDKNLERLRKSL